MKNKTGKRLLSFLMAVLLLLCEAPVVSFAADLSGGTESAGDVSESDVSAEDISEGDVSEGDVTAGDMTAGDALECDVTDGNAEWEIPEMNYAGEIPVSDYETLKKALETDTTNRIVLTENINYICQTGGWVDAIDIKAGNHTIDMNGKTLTISVQNGETTRGGKAIWVTNSASLTITDSSVAAMPKREKRELLDAITRYCMSRGYPRSSIWTFSNEPNASYSSMTRDNFLGFGCSATSLFKEQFKINTFDVDSYCERIGSGSLATSLTLRFTRRQRMIYWLFWTAYSTRVNAADFEDFFGVPLKKMYGMELWLAKRLGLVTEHDGTYEMTLKGAFSYHYYENFYTLSYIDKMWGILRKEAFPKEIRL